MQTETPNRVRGSRRDFLTRNLLAAGGIVATALTRPNPANACFGRQGAGRGSCGRSAQCFLKGTKIRTSSGERNVEDLRAGDLLPTHFGGDKAIEWVGRYAYTRRDASLPWDQDARPVRISSSAIAPNVPARDLFVTSGHALYIDGALVPAGDLINGVSIRLHNVDDVNELEYFHIKLDSHDLIVADGLACETLLIDSEKAAVNAEIGGSVVAPVLETSCARLVYFSGRRGRILSRLRSAVSPWFDFRRKLDIIRDHLEDRAFQICERA